MQQAFLVFTFLLALSGYAQKLKVVTSFTVLADMVKNIAEDFVEVRSIVQANGDPHTYEPSAQDICYVSDADCVLINGWHLDDWVNKIVKACGKKHVIFVATKGIVPRKVGGECDPHAWHNPLLGLVYVDNIAQILGKKLPEHAEVIKRNAERYKKRLRDIYQETHARLSAIPRKLRVVVTAHEGFGYFGDAFGITFYAPLGMSSEEEIGPKSLVSLIKTIILRKVKAVFAESITNDRLLKQISDETAVKIGDDLFSDALSEADGPAPTYEKMLQHNATNIVMALEVFKERCG